MRREWFDPFRSDLEVVFAAAEQLVQNYPEPMAGHALEQLHLINPLLRDSGHSYIGYIIPLWMQISDGLPSQTAHKLSTACLIHMMYFLNLDEVMDERPDDSTLKLSLGNLYYMDALRVYSDLFSPPSQFWTYFRQYVADWAVSVNGEKQMDYFKDNPLLIAQKAAPLQLGAVGALLLLNQTHRIAAVCPAVNISLMTLQMTDDFNDMDQDAAQGNYNSFLSHVSAALKLPYPARTISDQIRDNMYSTSIMNSYIAIAYRYHDTLTSSNSGISHLFAFNTYLCKTLLQAVEAIKQHKRLLHQGGFHYWISENALTPRGKS